MTRLCSIRSCARAMIPSGSSCRCSIARMARSVPARPRHRRPGQRPCRPRMNRRAVWRRSPSSASLAALGCRHHGRLEWQTSNLRDIGDVPSLDVWGDTVQARVIVGNNASLAVVDLAPGAIVPGASPRARAARALRHGLDHLHDRRRTAGARAGRHVADHVEPAARRGGRTGRCDRRRHLRPGPCRLGCAATLGASSPLAGRSETRASAGHWPASAVRHVAGRRPGAASGARRRPPVLDPVLARPAREPRCRTVSTTSLAT